MKLLDIHIRSGAVIGTGISMYLCFGVPSLKTSCMR